ncbi:MAG TPA: glutamate-1-semialdehyde 2,1-aminomutase [Chloroflexota bacterium]|jgi:glutamate-1-semialdehyde 2,1-aminomutase|nr:glutamate-1-semialdehyde 2,1-aminomutase [Chloroflexota bacterium]
MMQTKSKALFARAAQLLPGGVNSPVRAFRAVGGTPFFVQRAAGPYLYDVDGNRYIDYVCAYGPLILGHAPAVVANAVTEAVARGWSYGAPHPLEITLAELIAAALPSVEQVRFVNSGTEATMSALRLARAVTGRPGVIKFDGCYHGHADAFLVSAGSGVATLGLPDSPGVPASAVQHTSSVPYNDLAAVEAAFAKTPGAVAAVIVEPVVGNAGVLLPEPRFLAELQEMTRREGALLIFDEVMTGFRVAYGGAQTRYGVTPDLTCLGKIVGGGLPVGAYGGRADLMQQIAPAGPVYQAGTLSGNPLAMAAGIATLRALQEPDVYATLERRSATLAAGLAAAAQRHGVPITVNRAGSMFSLFFHPGPVRSFADAKESNTERFRRFHRCMLDNGIFLAPSAFEAAFVSLAHGDDVIAATVQATDNAIAKVSVVEHG